MKQLVFLENVGRYAFTNPRSVESHIKEGDTGINSGRRAIDKARDSLKSKNIWPPAGKRVDIRRLIKSVQEFLSNLGVLPLPTIFSINV